MPAAASDHDALKAVPKEALIELLRERRGEVRQLIEEVIEDIVMVRAIEEGRQTEIVSREEIEATPRGER
jgi:hypothetical protein